MEHDHDQFGVWHSDSPPKDRRTLILACLASAFVVAVVMGLLLKS